MAICGCLHHPRMHAPPRTAHPSGLPPFTFRLGGTNAPQVSTFSVSAEEVMSVRPSGELIVCGDITERWEQLTRVRPSLRASPPC